MLKSLIHKLIKFRRKRLKINLFFEARGLRFFDDTYVYREVKYTLRRSPIKYLKLIQIIDGVLHDCAFKDYFILKFSHKNLTAIEIGMDYFAPENSDTTPN